MPVLIVSPDADPETSSVDGWAGEFTGSGDTWATIIGAAGDGFTDNADPCQTRLRADTNTNLWDMNRRGAVVFDTSSMPTGVVILAAVLSLYGQTVNDDLGGGANAAIVEFTETAATTLQNSDYGSSFGSTRLASDIAFSSLLTSTVPNDFALNTTGLGTVDPDGRTGLGVMNSKDLDNSEPTWASAEQMRFNFDSAEGTDPPVLTVTYRAQVNLEQIEQRTMRGVMRGVMRGTL